MVLRRGSSQILVFGVVVGCLGCRLRVGLREFVVLYVVVLRFVALLDLLIWLDIPLSCGLV